MKKLGGKTGGGKLTSKETRIVESNSYRDAAIRLGISACGNDPRFDSDSQASGSGVSCNSKRLKRVLSRTNLTENLSHSEDALPPFNISLNDSDEDLRATDFQNILSQQRTPNDDAIEQRQSSVQQTSNPANVASTNIQQTEPVLRRSNQATRVIRKDDYTQMNEGLQHGNYLLQRDYLNLQIRRTKIAIEKEELQKLLVQIEVDKAQLLMMEEIEHKKTMMKLEVEAKQAEINRLNKNA